MQHWNINPESLLKVSVDAWVYWKDKHGVYLGCNALMANSLNFSSTEEIVGKTDCDLPLLADEIDYYRQQDRQVMKNNTAMQFQDSATLKDKTIDFFVVKTPLIEKGHNPVGILGISYYFNPIRHNALSQRETEVLNLLAQGKPTKEVANILMLSKRTVEHYLESIKDKMDVSSKYELLVKVVKMNPQNY